MTNSNEVRAGPETKGITADSCAASIYGAKNRGANRPRQCRPPASRNDCSGDRLLAFAYGRCDFGIQLAPVLGCQEVFHDGSKLVRDDVRKRHGRTGALARTRNGAEKLSTRPRKDRHVGLCAFTLCICNRRSEDLRRPHSDGCGLLNQAAHRQRVKARQAKAPFNAEPELCPQRARRDGSLHQSIGELGHSIGRRGDI